MKSRLMIYLKPLYLNSAGVAKPQTPTDAPPLAGFNNILPVAYNHNTPYLHDIDRKPENATIFKLVSPSK